MKISLGMLKITNFEMNEKTMLVVFGIMKFYSLQLAVVCKRKCCLID